MNSAFLADVSRRQIDRHPSVRKQAPGVLDCRAHSLAGFLHRRVGKSYDVERPETLGNINLYLDRNAFEADKSAAMHFGEHSRIVLQRRKIA